MYKYSLGFYVFALVFTGCILVSCSSSYRAIVPDKQCFTAERQVGNVKFSYGYDALHATRNTKYSINEHQRGVRLVHFKIENNSDSTLVLGKNYQFYCNNAKLLPVSSALYLRTVKQNPWPYLFYLLLTPLELHYSVTSNTSVHNGHVHFGYLLGPGITIYNVQKVNRANANLYRNLRQWDLWEQPVSPGETRYGLVAFEMTQPGPLELRYQPF